MTDDDTQRLTRRDLTRMLGVVGIAGLAGCPGSGGDSDDDGTDGDDGVGDGDGNGDGGEQELGERVPTLMMRYFSGIYATGFQENVIPIVTDNWDEGLGITVESEGKSIGNAVQEVLSGAHAYQIFFSTAQTLPDRLDPNFIIRDWYRIDGAGSRSGGGLSLNYGHYASCEYSIPALEQETAPSNERRRQLINEAQQVLAEDYMAIPVAPQGTFGAYNDSLIDVDNLGVFGINNNNVINVITSHPIEGTAKTIATPQRERINNRNPYLTTAPQMRLLVEYSPLIIYGPDAELRPYLAEGWEVKNEARTFEFTLNDATFQNGNPITASDVQFTYEFMENNHQDLAGGLRIGYESIETPDESTVIINFAESNPPFLTSTAIRIGIIDETVWAEADGNAGEFTPPMATASGPFAMTEFEAGRVLRLETHTGHPEAPDESDISELEVRAFNSQNTMIQALGSGEVMTASGMNFNDAQQAAEFDDVVSPPAGLATIPNAFNPSYPQPPTKFKEFRQALGMTIDRREILAVGLPGADIEPEFQPRPLWKTHPWAAPSEMLPTFTDDPTGDPEGARQVLSDAGWGWDDDGNLHYPPDADLSLRWESEGAPSPEEYPCLDEFLE